MEVSTRVSMEVEGSILYHYVLLINNVSTRVSMEVEGSINQKKYIIMELCLNPCFNGG